MSNSQKPALAIAVEAWRSPYSLKLTPILLTLPISLVSIPLGDGASKPENLAELAFASTIGHIPYWLAVLVGWLVFYRNKSKIQSFALGLIGLTAGASKGLVTQLMIEDMIAGQYSPSDLVKRIAISAISSALTLLILGVISYLLLSARVQFLDLRQQLIASRETAIDLNQQFEKTLGQLVRGLDQRLSAKFLKLTSRLNKNHIDPEAHFQALAALIRDFNRSEVRKTSKELWSPKASDLPLRQTAWLAFRENPLDITLSASLYAIGALLNEWRAFGLTSGLILSILITSGFILAIQACRSLRVTNRLGRFLAPHLVSTITAVFSTTLLTYFQSDRGLNYALLTGALTFFWAESTLFISGWLTTSYRLFNSEISRFAGSINLTRKEIDWLDKKLEVATREIAKYLHGIIQSRSLAYALLLETGTKQSSSQLLERQEAEIVQMLSSPMQMFTLSHESLDAEFQELIDQWQGVIEIQLETKDLNQDLEVLATIQLVREAISNSVKHGMATKARIAIKDQGSIRFIEITDNGTGFQTGEPGLGSMVFNSVSDGKWSLKDTNGQIVFTAELRIT